MENCIKDYEKFIKQASKHPTKELTTYHQEMITNFQHERAIHLAVTLFFAALTLVILFVASYLTIWYASLWQAFLPLYLAAFILAILSAAYVRHYFFLENHIQKLYDYNQKLHGLA